jgi:RNA polymerase sigma-70 factor (ECF subfamily)
MTHSPTTPDARHVFEVLVRDHADHLMIFLRAVVRDKSSVDDIFQDTMMVAWRRLADFDKTRSFGAWIRGIGARVAMDYAGKKRAAPVDPSLIEELERHAAAFDGDHSASFAVRRRALDDCMERLPPDHAEVLRLTYVGELSLRLIAAQLAITEEAAKKRVQRARALLGECLHSKGVVA